ncbi:MAG: hypothetical protein Q8L14_17650 [Myxococcales bacterium]|nr:hypothetical protein [Myxococcales bacterium]
MSRTVTLAVAVLSAAIIGGCLQPVEDRLGRLRSLDQVSSGPGTHSDAGVSGTAPDAGSRATAIDAGATVTNPASNDAGATVTTPGSNDGGCGDVGPTEVLPPLACSATPPMVGISASKAAFEASVIGRWLHCNGPMPFLANAGVGLELDGDHRWYHLTLDAGHVERARGFGGEGLWYTLDAPSGPGAYQLNLESNVHGTNMFLLRQSSSPRLITASWSDGTTTWAWAPGTQCVPAPPVCAFHGTVPTSPLPPVQCGLPELGVRNRFNSEADLTSSLVGRWLGCSVGGATLWNDGLDIDATGNWYSLTATSQGLGRDGRVGTWANQNNTSSPAGVFQVNFEAGGLTLISFPVVAECPRRLRLEIGGGPAAILIATP